MTRFRPFPTRRAHALLSSSNAPSGVSGSSSSCVTICTASSFSRSRPKNSCNFSTPTYPAQPSRCWRSSGCMRRGCRRMRPCSPRAKLEELRSLAQAWTSGTRPTAAQMQQWGPLDVLVFLQHLPRALEHASLAWLDTQLHLTGRSNYEILVEWLTIAAGSDYEPVFA